jgi:sorbose reductase
LLEHGLSGLALLDISTKHAKDDIDSLREEFSSATIIALECDIRDAERVNGACAEVAQKLGSIDILCCFAGVVGCTHALEMSSEEWRRTLDINTTGDFICAQAAAKSVLFTMSSLFMAEICI